jgi:SOS-response transcriptional repressor LexA
MPAAVIAIDSKRRGFWSLLEVATSGNRPVPYGILLLDEASGDVTLRLRDMQCFDDLNEQEFDILLELAADLNAKAHEMGGTKFLAWLEDSASCFIRVSDRTAVAYGDTHGAVDRLFDEHVDSTVRPYVTHLPLYGLRAAATKFGDGMDVEQESWVRAPENLRLTAGMFVAYVVGRSMEPMIPDGSACVFRAPVTGSRGNRYLLIEKFDENDFAFRYTVKKYARKGARDESADREQAIPLEPMNKEFDAFELTSDRFRVVAEFVQVLPS